MTIVSGKNPKVQYNQIKLGKDLKLKKNSGKSSAKHIIWKTPTLENMLGGYMLIVGKKKELLKVNPGLIVIDGSNQELLSNNMNDSTTYLPSGIVVLCICKLERESIMKQYS